MSVITVAARTHWRLLVTLAFWVGGTFASLYEHPPAGVPTELWSPLGVGFLWLTLVWDGRSRPDAAVGRHVLSIGASFLLIALVCGWSLREATWMTLWQLVGIGSLAWLMGVVQGGRGWRPHTGRTLTGLVGSTIVSTTLVSVAGGFPDEPALQLTDRLTWWWVIRAGIFVIIGASMFLVLFHGDVQRWRRSGRFAPWRVLLLVPLSIGCLRLTYVDVSLPLSWLLLLPAIWAAMAFTPLGAALHMLLVALFAALITFDASNPFTVYQGPLPSTFIVDLLLATTAFVSIQVALLRDDRKEALASVEEQRRRHQEQAQLLGQVFEAMSDGILVLDEYGVVRGHNAAVRSLLAGRLPTAWPPEAGAGLDLQHPDHSPVTARELPGATGRPRSHARVSLRVDDRQRLLDIRSRPLAKGQQLILFTDVTTQQERIRELTRFAGVVAHDMRTPLASTLGWIELAGQAAREGNLASALQVLGRAGGSARRMQQVLEDWLSYTVLREGVIEPSTVRLAAVAEEVLQSWRGGAGESPEIAVDLRHAVYADPALIRQLLANLVSNAVKFTPQGRRAHVRISSEEHEPGWVQVEVADRGEGFAPGEEDAVFGEFHRSNRHSQDVAGTGLGLALCRQIVQSHGGAIAARTNDEGGATVGFTLPTVPETEL